MSTPASLPALPTINDIIAHHPATLAVFNAFGVDACCGGAVSVEDAARRDGVDITSLRAALHDAGVPL